MSETDLTRRHLLAAAAAAPLALSSTHAFAQTAQGQPLPAGPPLS